MKEVPDSAALSRRERQVMDILHRRNGATVAERREVPELVPGVCLRDRPGTLGQCVARKNLRTGKTVSSAVAAGFDRAFTTIIDTHVTTIVAALFLFVFGTGPIRGFAVTLVLSLIANLFSAVYVSRTIFIWLLSRKRTRAETLSI